MSDRIRIEVSDTGPGIPADRVARLFIPFDRLGAERISQERTGLGLALSKHLIDAMGGALGFRNRPEGGASFHVDLPRAPATRQEAQGQDLATGSPSQTAAPMTYPRCLLSGRHRFPRKFSYDRFHRYRAPIDNPDRR